MSYYTFVVHKGCVAFRCDDGSTGSDPGTAAELIIRRFCAKFKIKEGEFEVIDARMNIGDFVLTSPDNFVRMSPLHEDLKP
jgi:hypothetical protein